MVGFTQAVADMRPRDLAPWSQWRADARTDYLSWSTPKEPAGAQDLTHVMQRLRDHLPEAIVANGAGN